MLLARPKIFTSARPRVFNVTHPKIFPSSNHKILCAMIFVSAGPVDPNEAAITRCTVHCNGV